MPQEDENWNPEAVWKDRRYRPKKERWVDERRLIGRTFRPYTHYGVGGNTKFWGSALFRLRREDFQATEHLDGLSPAWPIDYDTLAPFYDRAERLYEVHGQHGVDPTEAPRGPFPHGPVPHAARMTEIIERLRAEGLHPSPLPLGLRNGCILCKTCNSFACRLHAKSESDVCCIRPAIQQPNVTLWTNALARRLLTDASGRRVTAVEVVKDGVRVQVEAPVVVVSCGAVNSAALLLRSANTAHPAGLGNSSGSRRHAVHGAPGDDDQCLRSPAEERTVFQKTVAINDFYLAGDRGRRTRSGRSSPKAARRRSCSRRKSPWYGRWIPLSRVGTVGVGRGGLARDVRGPAAARQPRDRRTATDASGCGIGRTTSPRT